MLEYVALEECPRIFTNPHESKLKPTRILEIIFRISFNKGFDWCRFVRIRGQHYSSVASVINNQAAKIRTKTINKKPAQPEKLVNGLFC
jgi:hypothetical protein